MPRQVDGFRQNARITNNPNNTIAAGALAKLIHGPPDIAKLLEQALEQGVNDFLANIDKVTGLNLLAWAEELESLFGSGNLLGLFTTAVLNGWTLFQSLLDGIATAFNHSGVGHTVSDIVSFLEAIPGDVISGITTIEQNIIDAIANAMGHAGTGHTAANILTYLEAIPSSVVTNILGGASLGADVQAIVTQLTTVFGGITSTLSGLTALLGNTFGSTFPKVFPYTFGTSTSNTPGGFAPLAQLQQLVDGLVGNGSQGNTVTAAIGAFQSELATVRGDISQAILDGVNAISSGSGIAAALQQFPYANITAILGGANLGADIQALITQATAALGGVTSTIAGFVAALQAIPNTNITALLGGTSLGADVQAIVDNISNALGHAGTGHTLADILSYLQAIPGTVISGITTIEQNSLDAIANALGHAGTGHTTSDIQTYLGAIPATVITNILGSANLGADLQALVTNLTTVFGGVTTTLTGLNTTLGNTFGSSFPKVFPFTFGTSSSNTPGKFTTLAQFQQLIDGIVGDGSQGNTVVGAIAAFHNWLASIKADISQAILDGLNAVAGIGTAIETALANISHVNITSIFGNAHLGTDIQNFLDGVINAITGGSGSGNSTAAISTALGNIPHANVVIPSNAGSGSVTFDASSNGTPATGTSTTLAISPWSHTVAATANYLTVTVVRLTSPSGTETLSVSYGSQPMARLAGAGHGALSLGSATIQLAIYGLANPTSGTDSISVSVTGGTITQYTMQAQASSYIGVGSIGTVDGGIIGANSSPSRSVASATNDLIVQGFAVAAPSSETLSAYSQTSRYNPGSTYNAAVGYLAMLAGDAAGAASVSFSATASYTASNDWVAAAVNLVPVPATILGSTFRQYRASTGVVTMISGSGDSLLPNSFFDTNDKLSTDITSAPATANKITLSYDGTYIVTICLEYSGWNAGAFYSCPILYKNGSVAQRGNYDNNGLGSGAAFTGPRQSTFIVYCSANDTLQPGIMSNGAFSGTGEATGTYCYWEVALANRGVLS